MILLKGYWDFILVLLGCFGGRRYFFFFTSMGFSCSVYSYYLSWEHLITELTKSWHFKKLYEYRKIERKKKNLCQISFKFDALKSVLKSKRGAKVHLDKPKRLRTSHKQASLPPGPLIPVGFTGKQVIVQTHVENCALNIKGPLEARRNSVHCFY